MTELTMTPAQAADRLGCTESHLRYKANKHDWPSVVMEGKRRFTEANLQEILDLIARPARGPVPLPRNGRSQHARIRRAAS